MPCHQFFLYATVVVIFFLTSSGVAKTKEEWKSRVIYQLLTDRFAPAKPTPSSPCINLRTWCGGNFQGVIDHLDYIIDLGVDSIWISPIVANIQDGYHGYWAENIFEIEQHWGTEDDFRRLIAAAHHKDVWVMVDTVPNHMGYTLNCTWDPSDCTPSQNVNFSTFIPFDKREHYHEFCIIDDFTDQNQVELCRLANLPDLNQTVPEVREILLSWISDLTQTYGVDGYRIDTVRHIAQEFWPDYQTAAGVYCVGEVASDNIPYISTYQGPNGLDGVLNFPLRSALMNVLVYSHNMSELADNLAQQRQHFPDVTTLGIFADNHDGARFLNVTDDKALLKNALTYILFGEGIPILYYGSEQGFHGGNDPNCRESLWPYYNTNSEMFTFIKSALVFRKTVISDMIKSPQIEIHSDSNSFVFSRAEYQKPDGTSYVNTRNPDDIITVSGGVLVFHLCKGHPKVYTLITSSIPAAPLALLMKLGAFLRQYAAHCFILALVGTHLYVNFVFVKTFR